MSSGTPPYVFPPFGNIPKNWVLFGDGHFGPVSGPGGGGAAPEILVVCDTSAGNVVFTLPDPATLTDPKTVINVKNINGGVNVLTISPGVAGKIDNYAESISTLTNNQGFRFRLAQSADTKLPDGSTPTGWVCIETCFGGDDAPMPTPPYVPGVCSEPIPTAGPGDSYDIQIFRGGYFTWTKPVNAKPGAGNTVVDMIAGGAGGQSGRYSGSAVNTSGGIGGGGGQRNRGAFDPSALPATVPVIAPVAASGGARQDVFNGGRHPGQDGGDAEFGIVGDAWYLKALGGKADGTGGGGTPHDTASTTSDGGGGGTQMAPGPCSTCGGPGGGSGGGMNFDTNMASDGGDGGTPNSSGIGGGPLGGHGHSPSDPGNGERGGDGRVGDIDTPGDSGAGGGALIAGYYQYRAGDGGNGGVGAGGGGGGDCFTYGLGAGAGGNGGQAVIRVATLCS